MREVFEKKNKFRIYCDIESTGFDPIRNDLISIAMIVTDREMVKRAEFYETAKPDFNKFYSEDAEKIHGFGIAQLMSFQNPSVLCLNLLKFLKPFKDQFNFPQSKHFLLSKGLRYRYIFGYLAYELLRSVQKLYMVGTLI